MLKERRVFFLVFVLVFSLSMVLAGCGAANTTSTTAQAAGSSAAVTTAAATTAAATNEWGVDPAKLPYVELTWYMRGRGPEKDGQMVYDKASEYIKPLINASIKIIPLDRGSFDQKVTASIAAGETFDMTFTSSYAVNYRQNAQRGAFVALNDPKNNLFEKYAPKTLALLGPDFLAGSAIKGINYAIPVNKEQAHSYGYAYRKDIAEKYGLDMTKVKTMADIEPMLKIVKEKEPTMQYPLEEIPWITDEAMVGLDRSSINDNLPVSMYSDNRDKKFHFDLETPELKAYYDQIHKFYLEGFIRKDADTLQDYTPDLTANKVFAMNTTTKPGAGDEMTFQYGSPWVAIEMTPRQMSNDETMGAMNAISITSKNPERAMMFQELMNTDKYLNNLINFGIEGVHYVKKSDTVIDFAPNTNNGKDSGYNPAYSWGFANQFINYLFPNEDPNKWANYDAYNKSSVRENTLGFLLDQEPVKNELAACMNVASEFLPGLDTGVSDPAVILPKAIAKFKDAGIDKIVAEAQKQFDAWDASKK